MGAAFVGRESDLERLKDLFEDTRLVTLTGAGGLGKTRLALRFTEVTTRTYTGGVCICDLETARTTADVEAQTARALGIGAPASNAAEVIGRAIASRPMMLFVFDNFEQIASAAPATLGLWLAMSKSAYFLVTSREQLRMPDEMVHELAPLSLPRDDGDGQAESLRLWADRVAAVRPGYALTDTERPLATKVVRKLDGIPLAIELAAARTRVLGTKELLERLENRFAVLSHGARDASDRQRTMRGAIDWSWDLLDPFEKTALAQCAAFVSGFTMEAAEATLEVEGPDVLDVIQALREKSLLHVREGASVRLAMYETIRAYAEEKLITSREAQKTHERHAKYFTLRGEEWASAFAATGALEPYRRLGEERDNFFAVADRALERGSHETALRALVVLHAPFRRDGALGSYLPRLEAATADSNLPTALLARGLAVRGDIERSVGKMDAAAATLTRAVDLARQSNDASVLCFALLSSGSEVLCHGRLEEAEAIFRELATLARASHRRRDEAVGEANIAAVLQERGALADAEQHFASALGIMSDLGEKVGRTQTLQLLGGACIEQGRHDEGRGYLEQAIALSREVGDRITHGWALHYLGGSLMDEGRLEYAQHALARAHDELEKTGVRRLAAVSEAYIGMVHLRLGRREEALAVLERATENLISVSEGLYSGLALAYLAATFAALDRPRAAEAAIARAREVFHGPAPALADAIDLLEGCVLLAQAREDANRADALRAAVHARRAGVDQARAARSIDLRAAMRMLDQTIENDALSHAQVEVAEDGEWFRLKGGERIACGTRPVLKRLLAQLARANLSGTTSVDNAALVAVAWPGERMRDEDAKNRLYVSMNRLRKLGLSHFIRSDATGYALTPNVKVVTLA